jgi:hypothetical protein
MTRDNASHRVFKISELTRLVASHLVLIDLKGAVNLACACRHLEEPVLSTVWETQGSLYTLLKVLPEGTWDIEGTGLEWLVRGPDLSLGKSNAQVEGYFSSGLWGIRRQRLGTESNATRPGCAEPGWIRGTPLGRTPSANYASIHLPTDGFQPCKIYLGASQDPALLTSTYSSPAI